MAVSFNNIPNNIRVPLFYAEVDNSKANSASVVKKSLIIGQMTTEGSASEGVATLISSSTQAKKKFGRGSQLALMAEAYRNQDTSGELWCLPMAVTGTVASSTVVVKGTALESGTIALYIGSTKVPVTVAKGELASVVATSMVSAVNSNSDLPVTAETSTVEGGSGVTLTVKSVGAYGNDILVSLNLQGSVGGEENINGITVETSAFEDGAGIINYENAFKAVETETWYYIGIGDSDATSLDACKAEMQDSTGRWSYARMQYGHVFTAKRGSAETLVTFGSTRNDQHVSVFGLEEKNPNPTWIIAGAVLGRAAAYFSIDPARPLQTGPLNEIMATPLESRFGFNEQNTLLSHGIATMYVTSGTVMIQRCITTYQVNSFGDPDNSYLDTTTMFTLAEIITRLKTAITSKYPRHKLANDGTRFGPGQAIVTPSVIRSELIAQYASMETIGLVENAELFAKYLIVERDSDDPNRINVLLPPDLVNQLRIFALQAQFRLQYSAND